MIGATRAYFSDTETSVANEFVAGSVDLRIDNTSYYNGQLMDSTTWELTDLTIERFFNFADLKPGDWGEDTVSLHVDDNDAWVCSNITLTSSGENGVIESEEDTGDDQANGEWDGELDNNIQFAFWADDGDNVYEQGEELLMDGLISELPQGDGNEGQTYPIVDSNFNAFGVNGQPFPGSETRYVGKVWCFGELDLAALPPDDYNPIDNPPDCNGDTVTSVSQTDSVIGDISFYAVQARHNPDFTCEQSEIVCEFDEAYVSQVESNDQAQRKDGSDVLAERSDENSALGAPEGSVSPPEWFSLGFGGAISLSFSNPVVNIPGNDLTVYEITNGRSSYPEETAEIEVSQDGTTWFSVGTASSKEDPNGAIAFDISSTGLPWILYVRVIDTSNPALHNNAADGFDLDAVKGERENVCL